MSIISLEAARAKRVPRRDPRVTAAVAEHRRWLVRILDFANQALDQLERSDKPLDRLKAVRAKHIYILLRSK